TSPRLSLDPPETLRNLAMHWRIKGLTQKVLAVMPGGFQINDMLQRTVGAIRDFRAHVTSRAKDDWLVLAGHMRRLGVPLVGQHYLEIGTGWFPTLPVCYALAGAARCTTFDLFRHLDSRRALQMVAVLEPLLPDIAAVADRPLDQVEADYRSLRAATTI